MARNEVEECQTCTLPADAYNHTASAAECAQRMSEEGRTCENPADHHGFVPMPRTTQTWDDLSDLERAGIAIAQSRERDPQDEEDQGYNQGLEEALRIIDLLRAGKVRMASSGQVQIIE